MTQQQSTTQTPSAAQNEPVHTETETVTAAHLAEEAEAKEGAVDSVPDLQELLRQAELKAAEHYDAWLRAKAEAENARRRAEEEIAKARRYAVDKFAAALLPVKDSLEAALATENQTVESLREGVELTLKQLTTALAQFGIQEENPHGSKFDPNRHQAIGMIEMEGEPNQVAQVLQKGYLIHDRVLRPALVMVTKAKSAS